MTPTSSTDYTHVIIPENAASIAEGRGNVLEQGAINNDNTVYHIVHDFVLEGATINVPRNCVLLFDGGSLANGTLQGFYTRIEAPDSLIFNNQVLLTGFWENLIIQPRWFGAVGDGITDDSDAFEAMATCCSGLSGAQVWLPRGHYIINRGLVFTNDITIYGDGPDTILDFENVPEIGRPSNCILFTKETLTYLGNNVAGVQSDLVTTLSANVTEGNEEIRVVNASRISTVDILLLQNRNDYSYSTQREYYKQGEIVLVADCQPDGIIYLQDRLFASYDTSNTDIYRLNPIRVKLSHFVLRCCDYDLGPSDLPPAGEMPDPIPGSTGIMIVSGYQCKIHHIIAQGTNISHLTLNNCYDCEVSHISVNYCSVACGLNYGITISQSQNISVSKSFLKTTRHGLTTGGGGPFGIHIVNRNISISDSVITTFPFDKRGVRNVIEGMNTHGNSEYITVKRCLLDGGVGVSGDHLLFSECIITNENNECSAIHVGNSHCRSVVFDNNIIQLVKPLPTSEYPAYKFIYFHVREIDNQTSGWLQFSNNKVTLNDALRDSNGIIVWISGLADEGVQDFEPKLQVLFMKNVFNCNLEGQFINNKHIRIVGYVKEVIFESNVSDCGVDSYNGTVKLNSFIAIGNYWKNAPYAVRLNIPANSNHTYDSVEISSNVFFGEARFPIAVHKGGEISISNNTLRVGDKLIGDNVSLERQIIKISDCDEVEVKNNVIRYDGIETNRKWLDVVDGAQPTVTDISGNTIVPSSMPPAQS